MLREMEEELGLKEDDIEGLTLRYVTLRSTKGEIRQNYYFFAELKEQVDENLTSNEGICKWFPLDEIDSLEMPFTAKYMMEHYCQEGRGTNLLYAGVTHPEGVAFRELKEF